MERICLIKKLALAVRLKWCPLHEIADGFCAPISRELTALFIAFGIEAELFELASCEFGYHALVKVGDLLIDLSGDQFDGIGLPPIFIGSFDDYFAYGILEQFDEYWADHDGFDNPQR